MGSSGHKTFDVLWLGSLLEPTVTPGATLFIQWCRRHVLASENLAVCAAAFLLGPARESAQHPLSATGISGAFESVESVELKVSFLGPHPKLAGFQITQSHL